MSVLFGRLTVAALLSTTVVAQAPGPAPSFDVADIHVRSSGSTPNAQMSGGVLRGDRYDIRNATMVDLISAAYAVDGETVLGGPNWLERNRFDIVAKAPAGTPPEALQHMLQALLADRFKLVLHKDTKPLPAYLLTVGGTPKLEAGTAPTGDSARNNPCQPVPTAAQTSTGVPFQVLSCHGITMAQLVERLPTLAGLPAARVVDQTGLQGTWDFVLKWTARAALARAGSEGITMTAALEKLGLNITFDKAPWPVLVVDSVLDTPMPNPSGTAENLPAPPIAEFDAVDIRVVAPDTRMHFESQYSQSGVRVALQGSMKSIFHNAWNINDDDLLAGGPKWFDSTKYSLVANVSAVRADQKGMQFSSDDVKAMLRQLLIERFKIVSHVEQRPVDAYTLVVADKARLRPADPANRTKWFNGVPSGVKDPRDANPKLDRVVTVQNMTMAQFAEALWFIAFTSGYLQEPIVDATGISGAWDFVLSFSRPTGAVSLFDALQKELGLKLERHKRQMPVLVIDHIEERPTDR